MKLRITERKKTALKEQEERSSITVGMSPSNYLKLTTDGYSYKIIENFISDQQKVDQAKSTPKFADRKKIILGRKTLPKTIPEKELLSINLLLGGLNFLRPAEDSKGWGEYDPDKTGVLNLVATVNGNEAKIVNHEGRNRSVFLWMKGQDSVDVSITFTNFSANTVESLPSIFVPQFESGYRVTKQSFTPEKESGSGFKKVEGFLNKLGRFPKASEVEEIQKKNIKVAGQEAVFLKTRGLNPPGSAYIFSGLYDYGLYPKSVLELDKGEDEIKYLRELEKFKFKNEDGPVTIEDN